MLVALVAFTILEFLLGPVVVMLRFFNLVFADNEPSLRIWRKMGFTHVGTVPRAAKRSDGSYQDAHQMYIEFENKEGAEAGDADDEDHGAKE